MGVRVVINRAVKQAFRALDALYTAKRFLALAADAFGHAFGHTTTVTQLVT